MKILMVCLGNICRSPLAEGVLQHKAALAGLEWEIDSAGVAGYHIGEAPHHLSQKVAKLNGIDISKQKARKFRQQDLQEFDKIYAMSNDVYGDILRMAQPAHRSKIDLLLNEINPGKNEDLWTHGTAPKVTITWYMIWLIKLVLKSSKNIRNNRLLIQ